MSLKEIAPGCAREAEPPPSVLVLDLAQNDDLDVKTLDTLAELADELATASSCGPPG